MEVTVKREDLVSGLYLVQGVVERRTPQPILTHVLIEPSETGVALIATDMEMKKVNWSTRKDIIASTYVVIGAAFLIAALIFGVDIFLKELFERIGVLKT